MYVEEMSYFTNIWNFISDLNSFFIQNFDFCTYITIEQYKALNQKISKELLIGMYSIFKVILKLLEVSK